MTHICVSDLTITGSDNGLSPGRRQVIIWTNAELLLNGTFGTNFSDISINIFTQEIAFDSVDEVLHGVHWNNRDVCNT